MKESLFQKRILQNVFWLMGGRIAQRAIQLLLTSLTARYLGPENYGLLSYGSAYTGFFASFCTLGLQSILVKELLDHPGDEGEILGTSLLLRLGASVLSSLAILCIVFYADQGDPWVLAVTGLSCGAMVLRIFEVFYCWFQSRLQSKVTALTALAAYLAAAIYKTALLVTGKDVAWFAFASVLEQGCIAVLFLLKYWRHGGSSLSVSWERGTELLGKSRHFLLPGLMVAVYAQTDKIMLKQCLGETELACYSAAMSISHVWCFVLSALIDSCYPEITRAHHEGKEKFRQKNRQLYCVVFYLAGVVSAAMCVMARPLVALLYGRHYLDAAGPLRILSWSIGFSYLGVARNAWVVCENRQGRLVWVYLSGAVVNVGLNLLLIPRWGAEGAAAASLAAQAVTALIAPFWIRELRENAVLMLQALALRRLRKER